MIKYKLTDQDGYTRRTESNETKWEKGNAVIATGSGNTLCTSDVIHFYDSPEVAVFMNPSHANIQNPRLWEIEVDNIVAHDGTKGGCKSAKLIRELALPEITIEQRVKTAILISLVVYKDPPYRHWARNWLRNIERSTNYAYTAANAATYAANAAAYDANAAAYAAANAAAYAANAATYAANAATYAANAAAYAANSATGDIKKIQTILNKLSK